MPIFPLLFVLGVLYIVTSFVVKIVKIGCEHKLKLEKIRHGIPLDEEKPMSKYDEKIIDYRSQGLN